MRTHHDPSKKELISFPYSRQNCMRIDAATELELSSHLLWRQGGIDSELDPPGRHSKPFWPFGNP